MTSVGRVLALACAMAVASLAALAWREAALGRDELAAADRDAARGDWPDAIAHARSAARARVPGSPWPGRAARRLEALGHEAEMRGDDDTALMAYGALRAAILSTQAVGWDESPWRAVAEEGVARIASRRASAAGLNHTASVREALRTEQSPFLRTLGLSAAAFAMLGGLSCLARGAPSRRWRAAARGLLAGGLLLYALVLLMN